MSEDTLKKLEEAIESHVKAEYGDEVIVNDFFLATGMISSDENDTYHQTSYVASDSPIHAVYGLGKLALAELKADAMSGPDEDEEDE